MIEVNSLKSFDLYNYRLTVELPKLYKGKREQVVKFQHGPESIKLICVESTLELKLKQKAVEILMVSLTDNFLSQTLITNEADEDALTIGQEDIRMLYEYGISYSDIEIHGDYDTATAHAYKRNRRTIGGVRCLASKKYVYIFMSETKYLRLDKSIIIRLWLHLANESLTEQFKLPKELTISGTMLNNFNSINKKIVSVHDNNLNLRIPVSEVTA